ncbi:hypothetical protein EJ07DRAFT_182155 [Lizonia empirigonia]|nr:hypothetical protein EJ07DRAFT_182155 [Lizonia empirigonia]
MGQYGTLSSENWQLFYQQGCYFIRNRDFPSLQLGLTQDDRTIPLLRERSGSLGQQWSITRDGEGWQLMNGLLGNSSFLALAAENEVPGMSTSEQGSIWDIASNPSAGNPLDLDKNGFGEVANFEVASSSAATTPTPLSISTPAPTSVFSPVASSPIAGTDVHIEAKTRSSLAAGAISGITIGSFVLILAAIVLALLLRRRRRKLGDNPYAARAELPDAQVTQVVKYGYHGELDGGPPRSELEARQKSVELP